MRFETWSTSVEAANADCVVVGVFEDSELGAAAKALDRALEGALSKILSHGDFPGRAGETMLLGALPRLAGRRVLLSGLGPRKSFGRRAWRKALAAAVAALGRTGVRSAALALDRPPAEELDDYYYGRAVAEITGSSLYRINDLKTGKKPKPPALARVLAGPVARAGARTVTRGLKHGNAIAQAAAVQRNLGNLPGNVCTPRYLAQQARLLARKHRSLRVRVLDEAAMRREKMNCLLAVAQGSAEPPRLIVIEHRGERPGRAPVVLVGKGVTFDAGGISLKPPADMDEMKYDMSGAAAVIAALSFAADVALPLNVVGIVGAVENMPDGKAVKPGDIIASSSGQTVEILNTDAEGRLVLGDALHYARRFKPAAVVDMATLTGACVIALGHHHTGAFGNDEALVRELVEAGLRADDRAWPLPLTEEYAEQLKSNFADFANIGGRAAGAITAAAFLGKFTRGLSWAHLDIAGTAWQSGANKGSTGRPTPLLADFLLRRAGV